MQKAEAAKEKFDAECVKMRDLDKQKTIYESTRRTLETKLVENKMVKDELDLLEEGELVMKLIGPTLLKQETNDVKIKVDNRIEYIEAEIKRLEIAMEECAKAMDKQRKIVEALSTEFNKTSH